MMRLIKDEPDMTKPNNTTTAGDASETPLVISPPVDRMNEMEPMPEADQPEDEAGGGEGQPHGDARHQQAEERHEHQDREDLEGHRALPAAMVSRMACASDCRNSRAKPSGMIDLTM